MVTKSVNGAFVIQYIYPFSHPSTHLFILQATYQFFIIHLASIYSSIHSSFFPSIITLFIIHPLIHASPIHSSSLPASLTHSSFHPSFLYHIFIHSSFNSLLHTHTPVPSSFQVVFPPFSLPSSIPDSLPSLSSLPFLTYMFNLFFCHSLILLYIYSFIYPFLSFPSLHVSLFILSFITHSFFHISILLSTCPSVYPFTLYRKNYHKEFGIL